MVKSYLKYEQAQSFGVVTSATSNAIWTPNDVVPNRAQRSTGAGRAYVSANEEVLCWDVKKAELLSRWRDNGCNAEVTAIAQSTTDRDLFAVGHSDGSIRLWDSKIGAIIIGFNGHKSGITTLSFDKSGTRLASGAKDTDIIIWDLVSETGLFKLRGHKDQITGLSFIHLPQLQLNSDIEVERVRDVQPEYLLSVGKDALIKIWNLSSQHCIETHFTQSNGECWSLGMSPDLSGCITGGNDGELKIWSLDLDGLQSEGRTGEMPKILHDRGTISRQGKDRTIGIHFHPIADYIAVHGVEKAIEIWQIRSPEDIKKSLARKRRRRREKNNLMNGEDQTEDMEHEDDEAANAITEVFKPLVIVRTSGKVRSMDWAGNRSSKSLQLLAATTNNQTEMYSIPLPEKLKDSSDYLRTFAIEVPGHRTDVRAVSLSSDDLMLATASSGSLKIWNVQTRSCLRSLECGYALCCSFLPGDKIVIVGNKNGELELFDIASATLIDTIQAHDSAIWTLRVHPDGLSVVTGSADKTAKFWRFEVVQEEILGTKRTAPRLKLVHTRTLKVSDDILSLCFSPDSRLLAVATLDITVKVFFVDSLKQYLNLYGHKLPVLNMSISADSKLIATCSADKNVRLWGLDFGDCHKAFFAHDDSIMQVSFIPHPISRDDAHLFFSASKDGLLKTWDGDKFEHVQKLSGHHGEIWAMQVSRTGDFVVTASHDKSIRIWQQSDEPLFLEEERERELEELYDNNLAASLEQDQANLEASAGGDGDGETGEVAPASKQTAETLTSSEKITEALTICMADLRLMQEFAISNPSQTAKPPNRHPLLDFHSRTAEQHLLHVFQAIPSPQLNDALLLLSFSQLPSLFTFIDLWLEKNMNVTLACRVLFFLLKTHHKQVVASRELRVHIEAMQQKLRVCLNAQKEILGFNLAATRMLVTRIGEEGVRTIEDAEDVRDINGDAKGVKKRAFVNVA